MKVLITAGGTNEPIDAVRSIKNDATGKLSALIANEFSKVFPECEIFYVYGQNACMPECDSVSCYGIQTVSELEKRMENILTEYQIDVVIHAMAVSDYMTKVALGNEMLTELFTKWNKDHSEKQMQCEDFLMMLNKLDYKPNEKLKSIDENLFITLTKTPKVIEKIKQWSPNSQLIGFKLLSNVSHQRLIEVAHDQLIKNDALYVVANDNRDISGNQHIAYIVDHQKNETKCQTKQEIARVLVQKMKMLEEDSCRERK